MSWIQKLYETYEQCADSVQPVGPMLWPTSHFVKRAHIEVVIDKDGNFRPGRARRLEWNESPTLIPSTEASAGRTAGVAPHPLCEEIAYSNIDFAAGPITDAQSAYLKLLADWCESTHAHPKACAVFAYVQKGELRKDLFEEGLFPVAMANSRGQKTKIEDQKVFVRWRVEELGSPCSGTWEDQTLIQSWIEFDKANNDRTGFCMVTGRQARLALNHSRFLRWPGDGAKLISANDYSGFTFKGRFTDDKKDYEKQVCSVSFDVSQKAHNALRWLISRQAYRQGEQAVVTWAVSGKPLPDPLASTLKLFGIDSEAVSPDSSSANTGQTFALRLKKAIAGYGSNLEPSEDIVFMGLDSATPGRMAITFYRELKGSDFLKRVEAWHLKCAWPQNLGKEARFVGAPAPSDIAEAAYGRRIDDKLKKATVERLLPCIVDGFQVPLDLVKSATRHASNRVGLDHWEWEKSLGIACALFKGYHTERNYQMTLEQDRKSRDYLYGRLLAVADSIEGYALSLTDEGKKRETTAGRLMQRFADRPFSTWRNIELALKPYESRMRAGSEKSVAILMKRRKTLDEVMSVLDTIEERTSDAPLTGEFLLGYHTQRQSFWPGGAEKIDSDAETKDPVIQATSTETN
ncbi:MAG: type I-C CRISPR-associated protein Cas8c/Csd1 [Azonexus sp.]|nr:type I-C CRISPR-associated protein Cas8c/Csd1 [Azonexus sp.]